MADIDNGLPPAGTDITDKSISGVFIDKSETQESNICKISAVMIDKSEADSVKINKIGAVFIDKEPAGRNQAMFL